MSDTMITMAQPGGNSSHNNTTALNSTDSDGKNIVVTWLQSNKTNANSTPTISVSNEDFWKSLVRFLNYQLIQLENSITTTFIFKTNHFFIDSRVFNVL